MSIFYSSEGISFLHRYLSYKIDLPLTTDSEDSSMRLDPTYYSSFDLMKDKHANDPLDDFVSKKPQYDMNYEGVLGDPSFSDESQLPNRAEYSYETRLDEDYDANFVKNFLEENLESDFHSSSFLDDLDFPDVDLSEYLKDSTDHLFNENYNVYSDPTQITSSSTDDQVEICDEISRVTVHVGPKKTFRLLGNLLYYRKSKIKLLVKCRRQLDLSQLNIMCHLEYKSFKAGRKDEGVLWEACETPSIKSRGKEKGVFVEYDFPSSGDEIEISYKITYNVKEMCRGTGKNYVRIHFTIYFSNTEIQEIAVPMIWDTHGKPKKNESPVRIKRLCAVMQNPFPQLYYNIENSNDNVLIENYNMSIQPVFISQKFAFNGKKNIKEEISYHLFNLLKKVNLPSRFLLQKKNDAKKVIIHLALMNGVDQNAQGLKRAKIIKADKKGTFINSKQTQLAQLLVASSSNHTPVIIYDISKMNVTKMDIYKAFVFALRQAKKIGTKGNLIVNTTWNFSFGNEDLTLLKIFNDFKYLQNTVMFSSAGNGARPISPFEYPAGVHIDKNVCKVGSLKNDNFTPQESTNWGGDLFVCGSSTCISAVNAAVIAGYLWKIVPEKDNKQFLYCLLNRACGNGPIQNMRVLNNACSVVSKKRKVGDDESVDFDVLGKFFKEKRNTLYEIFEKNVYVFDVPRKRRRLSKFYTSNEKVNKKEISSLIQKIGVIRDIVRSVGSLNNRKIVISAEGIKIARRREKIDFKMSPTSAIVHKIRYVFKLFQDGNKDVISGRENILNAFMSFGITDVPTSVTVLSYFAFESFAMNSILPWRYSIDFIPADEEQDVLSALGGIIYYILKDEVDRNVRIPEIVFKLIKNILGECQGKKLNSIDELNVRLENVLAVIIENHKTKIERYCEELFTKFQYVSDPYLADVNKNVLVTDLELYLREINKDKIRPSNVYSPVVDGNPEALFSEEQILNYKKNFVVLGNSGSGKTWFLRNLAIKSARRVLENIECPIPIYVPILDMANRKKDLSAYIRDLMPSYPFVHHLIRTRKKSNFVFLFDGLDDIQTVDMNIFTKGVSHIVSSKEIGRLSSTLLQNNFSLFQIQPLNYEQQRSFVEKRINFLGYSNLKKKIFDILSIDSVQPFVRNPSLLSLLISTVIGNVNWNPNSSFNLCSKLLVHMIQNIQGNKIKRYIENKKLKTNLQSTLVYLTSVDALEFYENFAYTLHCEKTTQFSKVYLEKGMRDNNNLKVCTTINMLLPHSFLPLFVRTGTSKNNQPLYSFAHHSFQSHLTAVHLMKRIKTDMRQNSGSFFKSLGLWKQNTYNNVYKKYVQFMIGNPFYADVFRQLASGLEKDDFIGIIHYLHEDKSNHYLCNVMMSERDGKERIELIRNEFKNYKMKEHIFYKQKMRNLNSGDREIHNLNNNFQGMKIQ